MLPFLAALLANVAKPELEPEPGTDDSGSGSGSGSGKDNDDSGEITTAGIVLMTIGVLSVVSVLLYIFWPSIKTLWTPKPTPIVSQMSVVQETARDTQDAL